MFGSKLAQKMWETTAEKGIGSLLKPWQMKRESAAALSNKRNEMLILAQTQRDVDDIKSGKMILSLNDIEKPKLISLHDNAPYENNGLMEPHIDINTLANTLSSQFIASEAQKEINIAKSLLVAEEVLSTDQSEPTSDVIEDDWLVRWRDSAATSSSEKLQYLWGRILAGELKQPGSYSLRTVEFIKNLTQKEANQIQKLFSFVIFDRIIKKQGLGVKFENEYLDKELTFNFLSEMQSLGILAGVESMGLSTRFVSLRENDFFYYHIYNDKVMQVQHDDPKKELKLSVIILTPLGQELLKLCDAVVDSTYINYTIDIIKSLGFKVTIGDLVIEHDGSIFSKNDVIV